MRRAPSILFRIVSMSDFYYIIVIAHLPIWYLRHLSQCIALIIVCHQLGAIKMLTKSQNFMTSLIYEIGTRKKFIDKMKKYSSISILLGYFETNSKKQWSRKHTTAIKSNRRSKFRARVGALFSWAHKHTFEHIQKTLWPAQITTTTSSIKKTSQKEIYQSSYYGEQAASVPKRFSAYIRFCDDELMFDDSMDVIFIKK